MLHPLAGLLHPLVVDYNYNQHTWWVKKISLRHIYIGLHLQETDKNVLVSWHKPGFVYWVWAVAGMSVLEGWWRAGNDSQLGRVSNGSKVVHRGFYEALTPPPSCSPALSYISSHSAAHTTLTAAPLIRFTLIINRRIQTPTSRLSGGR